MNEKAENGFDERACEALGYLLGQFWILREKEPEKYQLVRDRERVLRGYLLDKLGLNLIVHRHFAKLEKVPVVPQVWMGIQEFSQPRDYALFCLLLAYLEGKTVEEQFLLSDLCEELQSTYPGEEGLNWTHYEHRKSLVRVLLKATDLGILKVVDGDIEGFGFNEGQEVLYEVPVVSRYFMRSYPKDIFKYHDREEILKAEWDRGYDEALQRRHRVYRQLFLTPAIHSRGAEDPDFRYLRNFRNRLREDIQRHTYFQFELYRTTALLTVPERRTMFTLFPDNKGISDLVLQFASLVREKQREEDIPLQYDGSLRLTLVDFDRWVKLLQERFGRGWSKQYREATVPQVAAELLRVLVEWQMAEQEPETGVVIIKPLLVRVVGRYPPDFTGEKGGDNLVPE